MKSLFRASLVAALFALASFAGDVTGKWVGKMETPNGSRDVTYTFQQDGEKLTGSTTGRGGETPIQDGKVAGDDLSFVIVRNFNGNEMKMNYKGKVEGSTMKLKFAFGDNEREMTLTKQ